MTGRVFQNIPDQIPAGRTLVRSAATLSRRAFGALALSAALAGPTLAETSGDPVYIGVSGPMTGPQGQYGEMWKMGFDLALEEINADGGINGRPLDYIFEDTQNDPRQTIAVAQKFIADPKISVEVGDFSSTSSMAASPLYQRGKLVQFGFTNSHPDFTKTGDYMWSNSVPQSQEQPLLAKFATEGLGLKKIAVMYLNTDWGKTSKDLFLKAAADDGAEVVAAEGYLGDEKDFRATLVRVRDAKPDGIMLESYYSDAALIVRQIRDLGIDVPIMATGSIYSPDFIKLAGDASEGVYTSVYYAPQSPRPEVQHFVKAFTEKYGSEPSHFSALAYDTFNLLATVMRDYGTSREDVKEGLGKIHDLPSVMFPKVSFDPETRRVAGPEVTPLVVKDGEFVVYRPQG
ncbi:ABC transporter substrate-binding protein [Pseudooceanicola sp. CBS1P-1]|uniref:ABC transporter substrate-binding protein n=1 Tax=Pseudooceanicola albus TaxID=2692189 RepID=A0A6L7G5G2_9RHOB|nr:MULTISPECIES: ABC transporter substrate-binding protein [Pseudooceanicola]MBT9385413.1 ABC transporter substrate-binding protein [Pseudooceanicola endophyticus]MXN18728.1 ABC transporter substrate-binding protein [Pseudooceanicola albus]